MIQPLPPLQHWSGELPTPPKPPTPRSTTGPLAPAPCSRLSPEAYAPFVAIPARILANLTTLLGQVEHTIAANSAQLTDGRSLDLAKMDKAVLTLTHIAEAHYRLERRHIAAPPPDAAHDSHALPDEPTAADMPHLAALHESLKAVPLPRYYTDLFLPDHPMYTGPAPETETATDPADHAAQPEPAASDPADNDDFGWAQPCDALPPLAPNADDDFIVAFAPLAATDNDDALLALSSASSSAASAPDPAAPPAPSATVAAPASTIPAAMPAPLSSACQTPTAPDSSAPSATPRPPFISTCIGGASRPAEDHPVALHARPTAAQQRPSCLEPPAAARHPTEPRAAPLAP
jgi:hypothetical protein